VDVTTLERPAPAPPPIDPRIRARRIQVQRGQGQRRLRRVIDVGLVLAVLAGFVVALWTPLLDVDELSIEGATRTGAELVAERSGISRGVRLAGLDLAAAGERVAALPWVKEVRLHRALGGTITIDVTERTPVATVQQGADSYWVDAEGRILGPAGAPGPDAAAVRLEGITQVPAVGGYLARAARAPLALASLGERRLPGQLASVRADDLTATLAVGGQVRFGDDAELTAKMRSLATVLDQVDLTCVALIDLRLPDHPVLTREEGCS
jgi:cell division protein FtsQ